MSTPNQSPDVTPSLSRRDFLKLMGLGTAALLLMRYIRDENQEESSWKDAAHVQEVNNGNKTEYIFSLSGQPSGEFFHKLQEVQRRTGRNSFSIIADQENDQIFARLLNEALPEQLVQKFKSGAEPEKLGLVAKQVQTVFENNHLAYYPWHDSDQNLESFIAFSSALGDRLQNRFTCYEAAVFAKEVFKKLGVDTPLVFSGIHASLTYSSGDQSFGIEPLLGKVSQIK